MTDIPVHDEIEPVPAAGAQALRLAGAWLTVLAFLEIASGLLVGCLFSSWRSHQESAFMVASVLGLFGACSLTATVSWRAATTHRPLAGVIAFTIGALALVVLLVPAASLLLPPNGLYGLDVNAVWSAARMPFSFAILVPAALMVFGTVRRWCVAGDALVVHRRTTVALAAALAILAPIGALVVVDAAQPACGAGRTCVPSAGISFVLPDGWSRTAPESEELYAATAGGPEARFVVEDGSRVLVDAGSAVPTDIDGVAVQVASLVEGGGGPFGSIAGVSTGRAALPVGPAVRVSYKSTTSFIFTYNQTTVSEWFFVDGRLIVLEYTVAYGETAPGGTTRDPPDLTLLLESVRGL